MDRTIAAIATAYGEGGIGIIRISGDKSKEILKKILKPIDIKDLEPIVNRRLVYGHIVSPKDKKIVDEVLAVYMKGPATYTREDVVEIYCHGSIVSLKETLSLVIKEGAEIAERGEFTKRAFLNGRIDLAQAEAVIDLIRAKTQKSYDLAMNQMEGRVSKTVRRIRNDLIDILAKIAVNIDYSDEDIEEIKYDELIDSLSLIYNEIDRIAATADTGKVIREGLRVAIVGKPNVGKSSLMNVLLGESRAIVTDIPGTTRDTIEELLNLEGIPIYLTDTAGIHLTQDPIEQIGIEKSKEASNKSDLILFVIDGSQPLSEEDKEIIKKIKNQKIIALINKMDKGRLVNDEEINALLPKAPTIETAITKGNGIEELKKQIISLVYSGEVRQEQSDIITNVRHEDLLTRAKQSIGDAKSMAEKGEALDFIEIDLRDAWELLGEIIGETVTEDIIDKIFEQFCLGK